jgi:hypothetical protein
VGGCVDRLVRKVEELLAIEHVRPAHLLLGHSAVFSFARAVCSKLAPELDGPLDRVNAIIRPLRHKALYDHVYPTREQGRDAYDLAAHLVPALAGVAGTAER